MVIVRPVIAADLEPLLELAHLAGAGLTTLPTDREILSRRIANSQRAFAAISDRPQGESYLLVMEDTDTRRVIGACGIVSKVGGYEPFYSYRIERERFESDAIGVRHEVPVLRLHLEHDGPCEIGSLFLHPDYRRGGNGRLLQLVRFLFIAEHPSAFESTVVSEIRGVSDADGNSPFWDAVGRHFFGIDFRRADYLSVVNKKFIAELMPRHPIYIPILPKSAQDVIGLPHEHSRQAVKNLQAEGFAYSEKVDIFDAGPVLTCRREDVRSVRDSARSTVVELADQEPAGEVQMIGTTGRDFRACKAALEKREGGGVRLARHVADALRINVGDSVRHVTLHAPALQQSAAEAPAVEKSVWI
jgi:arginine N-succinyltransferase